MSYYGPIRPLVYFAEESVRSIARRGRCLWRQRRLEVGAKVQVSTSVDCVGEGRISIGEGTIIRRDVRLVSGHGALIEIGPGSIIGNGCVLQAGDGHVLRLGANFQLGANSTIYSAAGVTWGDNGGVGEDSQIGPREPGHKGQLNVGQRCHFQCGAIFDLCTDICIGDDVRAGARCTFYTHNHSPKATKRIWEQGLLCASIHVGSGVWIGQGCSFLPGVDVASNSIVAAGAIVTKNVDAETIVGGVPARLIGRISD